MNLDRQIEWPQLLLRPILYTAILCLLLTPDSALSSNKDSVRVATFVWPHRTEANGTGAYLEILRQLYSPHQLTLDISYGSIQDALGALYRDETDIMLVEWHPDILKTDPKIKHDLILAPRFPLDTEQVVAVSQVSRAYRWPHILSSKSHHLAWIADYNYQYFFDLQEHPKTLVNSTEHGLTLVKRGRIDSYLDDLSDVEIVLSKEAFSHADFYLEIVQERNLYPLFNHSSERRGLLKIYDLGMQKLLRQGKLKRIFEKHSLNFERIQFPTD